MNELLQVEDTTIKTMTSREFAYLADREHKNIVIAIDSMNEHLQEMGKATIASSFYKANNGGEYKQYILTKDNAELIAMKMDTKIMIKVHEKFKELQKPQTFEEIMKSALLLADQKVKQLQTKIQDDKPRVEFANTVADSSDVILVREYAKLIYDKEGISIGQNKLYKWFRDNGYLNKKNEPYQQYMSYFRVVETTQTSIFGTRINKTTKITGQGQLYFLSKLKEDHKLFDN